MKRIFPKSKLLFANIAILLIIFGGFVLVESGPESWVDREMAFDGRMQNSLIDLDRAKFRWAEEKSKPEVAIPTFDDLAPYLGDVKDKMEQLKALGVEFTITSTETNQSDVATLTRGVRFRAGFCTYYRAGTTFSVHTGWKMPPPSTSPITFRIRLTLLHAEYFLGVALVVLAVANVIIFFVRNLTRSLEPKETWAAASAEISPNPALPARIRARDLYVLIFGCLFCMLGLGLLSVMSFPRDYLIEDMGNGVGAFLTVASLALPFLCLRFLKAKPTGRLVFLVSLVPATCILWSFLSAWFVPLPFHVAESGTKRITRGMTKAQVLDALGSPRGSSGEGTAGKMRLTYDYQIPWGWSGRQYFVDLIDDRVVSAKIVRYGGELNDDFWESDFIKDLKAGKALPGQMEVQPDTNRTPTAAASGR